MIWMYGLSPHRLEDRLRYVMTVVLPIMEERRKAHRPLLRRGAKEQSG
jgi:hypothetical protein